MAAGLPEPDAMALATASPDGMPSVRIVLLKGIDDRGLQFFTNYGSRKGRELDANPRAAVTLLLAAAAPRGAARRAPSNGSPRRSRTRTSPRAAAGSRLGRVGVAAGHADPGSRDVLEARAGGGRRARIPGDEVPRPDYWGGYRLVPDAVELWQGRANRLHDREHFLRAGDGGWRSERLSP